MKTSGTDCAYIALGSNLEDPVTQIERGFADIDALSGTRVTSRSSLYRSAPVGYLDQPDFVNAVAGVETALAPAELLKALLDIETRHGRKRERMNGPRTLDLDIVVYGDREVNEPGLHIPHPRMGERAFVIVPLAEIAPGLDVPGLGPVSELLARVDRASLQRVNASHP